MLIGAPGDGDGAGAAWVLTRRPPNTSFVVSRVRASRDGRVGFAVTLPGTTALIATNDIKAVYDLNRDGSGQGVLGQTSHALNIDSCTAGGCGQINPNDPNTPEPGTMVMMLSGMGLVGIGAFRKLRS